jgi:hypothetical protein
MISREDGISACESSAAIMFSPAFSIADDSNMRRRSPLSKHSSSYLRRAANLVLETSPQMTDQGKLILFTSVASADIIVLISGSSYTFTCFPKSSVEVDLDEVNGALRMFELDEVLTRPEQKWQLGLSPGERQRFCLVRVFLHNRDFCWWMRRRVPCPKILKAKSISVFGTWGFSWSRLPMAKPCGGVDKYSLDLDERGTYDLHTNCFIGKGLTYLTCSFVDRCLIPARLENGRIAVLRGNHVKVTLTKSADPESFSLGSNTCLPFTATFGDSETCGTQSVVSGYESTLIRSS